MHYRYEKEVSDKDSQVMNLLRGHDIHSKVFAVCAYDSALNKIIFSS